ncbi:MAG TPA: acyloxyacyl hydrolase [Phycisphaerales bacterium]|nr:acyloxyacyl hydrolase [Phycisphaerales bacterium]
MFQRSTNAVCVAAVVAGVALPALAGDGRELTLTPVVVSLQPEATEAPVTTTTTTVTEAKLDASAPAVEFGKTGSRWIGIGAGAASNGDFTDVNLYGRYEYFIAKDIELIGELGIWNYQQEGKDATGFNPALVLRYHFYNGEKWTWFVDGGIGFLFSTDPVNRTDGDEGSSFNFTPRAGGGFTRAIGEEGARLEVGMRWAHVSNARISGNNDNPGRDSLMLYAGLIFPF